MADDEVSMRMLPRASRIAWASKVIRSERARINGPRGAGRLPILLMQVKAPNAGAMSLIVLPGSIG
jgi:hypothetical protein